MSWRARGTGATCTAEIDNPIRGYRVKPKYMPNAKENSVSEGSNPTVTGISFDGDTYWVRLSALAGWPLAIRITQGDVDAARARSDDIEID